MENEKEIQSIVQPEKTCKKCGEKLTGKQRSFCSNRCSVTYFNELYKGQGKRYIPVPKKICPVCNKPSENRSKYCSNACMKRANRERTKKLYEQNKKTKKQLAIRKVPFTIEGSVYTHVLNQLRETLAEIKNGMELNPHLLDVIQNQRAFLSQKFQNLDDLLIL